MAICNYEESKILPGAVSDSTTFCTFGKDASGEANIGMEWIAGLVNEDEFTHDMKNGIYVNENGAVSNAYDFSLLDKEKTENAIKQIIAEKKSEYPEYEFVMVEGKFPMDATGQFSYYSDTRHETVFTNESEAILSTHILYIKNYKKYLDEDKKLVR